MCCVKTGLCMSCAILLYLTVSVLRSRDDASLHPWWLDAQAIYWTSLLYQGRPFCFHWLRKKERKVTATPKKKNNKMTWINFLHVSIRLRFRFCIFSHLYRIFILYILHLHLTDPESVYSTLHFSFVSFLLFSNILILFGILLLLSSHVLNASWAYGEKKIQISIVNKIEYRCNTFSSKK